MGIADWPLSRIMQMPDEAFGRRWPVFVEKMTTDLQLAWDISEIALPEHGIIWETAWQIITDASILTGFRLALGDRLPITNAEMMHYEPVLHGCGAQGMSPRRIDSILTAETVRIPMRKPVHFGSRRLVLEVEAFAEKFIRTRAWIVVSSMPTEVPQWLNSGRDKNRM